ncbi:uncharacterized protein LDX57_002577 [Aspergillus melleus]|uniref:uncharacterized protein n=1 Tax=Aspergillus melleus TaxID=138277 RepID=UPI001E8D118C|nr:uncharacterized protein LDX57_002577 [Aspergillus melleus]KAH8424834.1 hypothetical protein LDX57_002577 [Aspergillus melleus]
MAIPALSGIAHGSIHDIRHKVESQDLRKHIVDCLSSEHPSLPSLLLWDDKGQHLFDQFCRSPTYYPFHNELQVFRDKAEEITAQIPSGSTLIELGAGCAHKTAVILSTLHRQQKTIHYFAVDVSQKQLAMTVDGLLIMMAGSESISISGLYGTYEDLVPYLAGQGVQGNQLSRRPITFLWMGNSITNFDAPSEAAALLADIRMACSQTLGECKAIVSVDVCQDANYVADAYNVQIPSLDTFLNNSMAHANKILGANVFKANEWGLEMVPCVSGMGIDMFYVARQGVCLDLSDNVVIRFRKGCRVHIITSGKWPGSVLSHVAERAGFRIEQGWMCKKGAYGVFCFVANAFKGGHALLCAEAPVDRKKA